MSETDLISAQVVPAADAVAEATRGFAEAGFQVGPVVGNSFSIAAPRSHFERTFRTRLKREAGGGIRVEGATGEGELSLPVDHLPENLRRHVSLAIFTPPPAFGPTNP